MKLVGTIEILNRAAFASGQSSIIKGAKSVLQIRKSRDGNSHSLVMSTNKNSEGQQYEVKNIATIRSNFIQEGKLTIELREPKINLFIRNCKSSELEEFLLELRDVRKITKVSPTCSQNIRPFEPPQKRIKMDKESKRVPGVLPPPLVEEEKLSLMRKPLTKTSQDHIIPQLSKSETKEVRKKLRINNKVLTINKREDYPFRGFPEEVQEVYVNGLSLKKIDSRLSSLQFLSTLDLSNNNLTCVENLKKLPSVLEKLNLANNRIEELSRDLLESSAFAALGFLNLNQNKLKQLPLSVLNIESLKSLLLSENQLVALPFNLHKLKNLQVLCVDKNKLTHLPVTIEFLKLQKLNISDNLLSGSEARVCNKNYKVGEVPTLMSLAAESIMAYNSKCRPPKKKIPINPKELPPIVREYLEYCVYCIRCGGMALNYSVRNGKKQPMTEELICASVGALVNVRIAYCYKCTNEVKY